MYYLNRFKDYYKLRDFDSIVAMNKDQLQIMIEDYVIDMKKGRARSSVAGPLHAIEAFLDINDIMLNWKKTRRLLFLLKAKNQENVHGPLNRYKKC